MKRFFAGVVVLAVIFCVVPLKAEGKECPYHPTEIVNAVLVPIEIFGACITTPFRVLVAGGVSVNNAIYKDHKMCYYCVLGTEHTPEQCTATKPK